MRQLVSCARLTICPAATVIRSIDTSMCRMRLLVLYFRCQVNPAGPPPHSLDTLYLEGAVCFYTQRTHDEVPLGIGISCSKDLRCGMCSQCVRGEGRGGGYRPC